MEGEKRVAPDVDDNTVDCMVEIIESDAMSESDNATQREPRMYVDIKLGF